MDALDQYLDFAVGKMQEVRRTQRENIAKAAELVAESCLSGGRFYVFGSGHSHMVAEELYLRAGGLAFVKAILPPELMLHEMPKKSTWLERLSGYAEAMISLYKVDEKDTLMVVSNSGRNSVPVQMCLEAKKVGAKVIALTSMKHSGKVSSRDASGKKVYEVADVTIDNCAEKGDAAFYVDGFDVPVGPSSDFAGTAIAQALIVAVVERLINAGMKPPVFKSSNLDGADAYNDKLFDQYYGYFK